MKTPEEIKYGLASHGYEICDKRCAYHDWRGTGYDCCSMLCQDAHTYIEQLESQIPRWIPVEERLPEKHAGVIVCCEEGFVDLMTHDGKHWNWNGRYEDSVTHWMPLPEPPKEEDEK